jgi:hypothetical protein
MTARMLLLAPLALLSACSDLPKAPPLTQESVYQNDAIGLRFLVPAGWTMQSRAVLPSGPLPKPIVMVTYQGGSEKPAEFRLLVAEVSENADLPQFLAGHPVGPDKWALQAAVEPVAINESQASRFVLTRMQGKEEFRREVTAFRRGERVYFFLVDFAATDAGSRDAVRTAINSVTWKK